MAHRKDKSFHHMVATDEIILQPESIIKKPVVENTRWRKKQLGEVKNGNSSALAEKNNISILGANMIRHVNDIEVSQKSENSKVLLRKFSGFKAGCMKNRFRNAIIQTLGTPLSFPENELVLTHSVHWGINTTSSPPPLAKSCQAPPPLFLKI